MNCRERGDIAGDIILFCENKKGVNLGCVNHIFQKAELTSNKREHNEIYHFLAYYLLIRVCEGFDALQFVN